MTTNERKRGSSLPFFPLKQASWFFAFKAGALAGIVALIFSFFLRLGGVAPFAPETAIEAFVGVVPASLEQPLIQNLGDGALLLGLAIATIIAILVYGIFGIVFEKVYLPWARRIQNLNNVERFLSFSVFPWLFFGLIVFPLARAFIFGLNAPVSSPALGPYSEILFPLALLFSQLLFGLTLTSEYKSAGLLEVEASSAANNQIRPLSQARRTFIERSLVLAGAGILALAGLGSLISSAPSSLSSNGIRAGSSYELTQAPEIFQDPRLQTLVNSEITSNANFYRVAIDLFDPSVNPDTWKLTVSGGGKSESYDLNDLKKLPSITQYTTFECVSNLVNGNLISNASWGGFKISDLLSDAGLSTNGVQYVVFYSVDGYSVGIPLSKALMADSILAYQMNGAELPQRHGYPLRAVLPGIYGMMSAKWINSIELVDSFYNGYWQSRGYTPNAIINTLAFITVPGDGSEESLSQNNGSLIVGGYAFAGDRGISKVELSFDQGRTWQQAILKPPISNLTWTLWAYKWQPGQNGSYQVYARATDGLGQLQTASQASPFPSGATGYAMITINVVS